MVTASGLTLGALPGQVNDPEFLGFVLDFVMGSDATVLDFVAYAGLRREEPALAQAVLAGADASERP
jgi:hypothetical protein